MQLVIATVTIVDGKLVVTQNIKQDIWAPVIYFAHTYGSPDP